MTCETTYCKNPAAKNRKICHKCIMSRFKHKNPEKYAYFVLRNNARRRLKEFTLTFQDFVEFAVKCEYMHNKGIGKTGMHIDRIKEYLGYTRDNIQPLQNCENVKKYLNYCYNGTELPADFRYMVKKELNENEYPF